MEPRHFAAYENSVFRHYVHFGPPGVDLLTFEHILSQWDKRRKKFVLPIGMMKKRSPAHSTLSGYLFKYVNSIEQANNTTWGTYIFNRTSDAIGRALKGLEPGKTTLYLQGCTPLVCLWYYELTGIKKPAVSCTVMPQDIDEDVEQPNEALEKMEWP
ncbi:uncharacterized protein A4U43_C07F30110 [Asparagus officinalis]|uniref:Uncharacterized protein n=1 Tax=Asparagus officinalis TaxID=4686 RepID=A0A5P1EGB5_ASPOF|nr:uncharacterized protein A4U43_C07F30110 [Asparagus officinalis]